jgi:uncharacterized membrane protein YeaQ/YmgE (transglycosylase-associated protein family)
LLTNLISWVVFGLIAGVIAKLLMPGKDPGGCVVTMLIGIGGAVIGGFLAHVLNFAGTTGRFGDRGFLIRMAFAVIGAIILLGVYRLATQKKS